MRVRPLGHAVFLLVAALAALTACDGTSNQPTGAGGFGGDPSPAGGSTAGTTTTTTTTTTSTTAPLSCPQPVMEPEPINPFCNILAQDCEPGRTCRPTNDGTSTYCAVDGGLKSLGKPCSLTLANECQAGSFCIGPPGGVGVCTRPCCSANDEPCQGGDCNVSVGFPGGATVMMCSFAKSCTLFSASPCPDGGKCYYQYPLQDTAVCVPPSEPQLNEGAKCQFINQCPESSDCYLSYCRYNCLLSGGAGLPPGQGGCPTDRVCKAVYIGSPGMVGVCLPP